MSRIADGTPTSTMLVQWIMDAHQILKQSACGTALDVNGVDAMEVLFDSLYLSLLHAVRRSDSGVSPIRSAVDMLRIQAHRLKRNVYERRLRRHSANPQRASVLFWPRGRTHSAGHIPLAAALSEHGATCRFLANDYKTFNQLHGCRISVTFSRAAWPAAVREARRAGSRKARRLAAATLPELAPFPGSNGAIEFGPIVHRTLVESLPDVCESVTTAATALDVFQPEVLVVGNDLTLEGRAAALLARTRGVASAALMHGYVGPSVEYGLHCVDQFFVYGDLQRRALVALGADPRQIQVQGAPYLDGCPRQTGCVHPVLQSKLGIRPGDSWILVATSGPGHSISLQHHLVTIQSVMRLTAALPHVTFVAKLHPKDHPQYYQQAAKVVPESRLHVIPHDTANFPADIFEWLQGCRIVLTGASTVAMEAILMDVPVITMDFCDELHGIDFIDAGTTTHATTEAELTATVNALMTHGIDQRKQDAVRTFLNDAFGALDGKSANRLAEAILQLGNRTGGTPNRP